MTVDPGPVAAGLAAYYASLDPTAAPEVRDVRLLAAGWESEIHAFDLESRARVSPGAALAEPLVVRAYTGAGAAAKAEREHRALAWLHAAGYPVPRVRDLATDPAWLGAPFIVMERVAGETLARAGAADPAHRTALLDQFCQLLADLHMLSPATFDAAPHPDSAEPIRWSLQRLRALAEPLATPGFERAFDWLADQARDVAPGVVAVVHLDYHPGNVLVEPTGRALVIDWTQAQVADPRFDLGWTLVLMGAHDGSEVRARVLDAYERSAGRRLADVEYFEAVAALKRLFSIVVSLRSGAAALGMRAGAERQMAGQREHVERVYARWRAVAGLALSDVEALLGTA